MGELKPSKKMKQTRIKDAANVIRISRRHTRDWQLIYTVGNLIEVETV